MRPLLGILIGSILAVACAKNSTPTELAPGFTPPPVVVASPTPTPAPPSILGVSPREIEAGVATEVTISGAGFRFPASVQLRSGQHVLDVGAQSVSATTIKAIVIVTRLSGFPLGTADLVVGSPSSPQVALCPACIMVR